MTLRNAFEDLATEGTLAETRDALLAGNEVVLAGRNANGATVVGNARTKFRDGFTSTDVIQPNPAVWLLENTDHPDTGDGQGHIVSQRGDAMGSAYLRISLSPFVDRSAVALVSRDTFRMPMRVGFGVSQSQRVLGQEVFYGMVEADDADPLLIRRTSAPVDRLLTGTVSVTSNVATFTIADHGFVGGDRVIVVDALDTRFNVGPVSVTVVDKDTITLPVVVSNGTYTLTGAAVREIDPGSRGANYFGHTLENTTVTNASMVGRRNGGKYRTRNVGIASTSSALASSSPYTDSFIATGVQEMFLSMDECSFRSFGADGNAGMSGIDKYHQNIPDEELDYRIVVRCRNLEGMSRPVARIVSIVKSGSATATVTTDRPHGLTASSRVGIYGVRDLTNFPNTPDAGLAATPTSETTFTVTFGSSTTSTNTQGGVVWVNHGSVTVPGVQNFAIQSISRNAKGVLIVTVNTTASGPAIGDWLNLWGMTGGAEVYEGAYRLLRMTGSTFELEAPGEAFASITTGGAIIRRTDVRLHFARVLDHTRHYVEVLGGRGNTSDGNNGVPVTISGAPTIGVNPNTLPTVVADQFETSTSLSASALYSGSGRDIGSDLTKQHSRIRVMIRHVAGLVPGALWMDQSTDNSNWYETWRQAIPSDSYMHTFEVPLHCRYYRWRFQNGATAQTQFFFQTRRYLVEGAVASELDKVLTFPLSTTALAANATFTSVTIDLGGNHGWEDLRAISYADQSGTLYIDQSRDGTNWRTLGTGAARDAQGMATVDQKVYYRYVRVRYVNGAVAQTAFSLDLTMSTN